MVKFFSVDIMPLIAVLHNNCGKDVGKTGGLANGGADGGRGGVTNSGTVQRQSKSPRQRESQRKNVSAIANNVNDDASDGNSFPSTSSKNVSSPSSASRKRHGVNEVENSKTKLLRKNDDNGGSIIGAGLAVETQNIAKAKTRAAINARHRAKLKKEAEDAINAAQTFHENNDMDIVENQEQYKVLKEDAAAKVAKTTAARNARYRAKMKKEAEDAINEAQTFHESNDMDIVENQEQYKVLKDDAAAKVAKTPAARISRHRAKMKEEAKNVTRRAIEYITDSSKSDLLLLDDENFQRLKSDAIEANRRSRRTIDTAQFLDSAAMMKSVKIERGTDPDAQDTADFWNECIVEKKMPYKEFIEQLKQRRLASRNATSSKE